MTVTVTATDDFIDEAKEESHTMGHTLSSQGDYRTETATINTTVTVEDNDDRGIELSTPEMSGLRPIEGVTPDTYMVRLTSQPTDTRHRNHH